MAESPTHSTIDDGDASPTAMNDLINTFHALIKPTSAPTNPCLTLFLQLVFTKSVLPHQQLTQLLQQSWIQNPLSTLKIIFNSWGVKQKENFFVSTLWLYKNHPKTLSSIVETLANFGYLKEVVDILCRIIQISAPFNQEVMSMRAEGKTDRSLVIGATRSARNYLYENDKNYELLEDQITGLFIKLLESDIAYMKLGESKKISLAFMVLHSDLTILALLTPRLADYFFPRDESKEISEDYALWVGTELREKVFNPLLEAVGDIEAHVINARTELKIPKDSKEFKGKNPEFIMNVAISGKLYEEWAVYD